MHIIRRKGWEISESRTTPEHLWLNRRALLAAAGAATILRPDTVLAQAPKTNVRYVAGRAVTAERDATTYNNYYEFGTSKNIVRAAQALPQKPWAIKIEGMVKTPRTIDIDDLVKQVNIEERIYRHRCVEAWAMTVPWSGFALSDLLKIVEPMASAKYVVFITAEDKKTMVGLRQSWYPWPYTEGVTIAEAANEMAFMATGLYGKPLPPQNGGPLHLILPWKYGFKGAKSVATIRFTDEKPKTFWEQLQGAEYGFWANVNPDVSHPRWSQASERLLGNDERVPTQIWNGYGEFVASLYKGLEKERLFV